MPRHPEELYASVGVTPNGWTDGRARLRHAHAERLAPLDFLATLVNEELQRRQDRLLERSRAKARFRDPARSLDTFDFTFDKKMNRALVFTLATCRYITQREDAIWVGPHYTGKSYVAQALGQAAIQQGHRVLYREAHVLLEVIMRRFQRASTILTSNRPVDDWGKLLGDTAAVTAFLDRLLHHAHILTYGARIWRTKLPAGSRRLGCHRTLTQSQRAGLVAGFAVSISGRN